MADQHDKVIDRVRGAERIASLDVIRGIAILFILFMNIPSMGSYAFTTHDFRYPTWTTADWWTQLLTMTYLHGTQRGLLELLFGAGIMIMARRAMHPDGPVAVADLHYRRNLWLCVLGLFNAFVLMWFGDILLTYGIAAVFLFPFRILKPRTQCAFAALLLTALVAYSAVLYREGIADQRNIERIEQADAAHKKLNDEDKKILSDHRERLGRMNSLPANNASARERIAKVDKAHKTGFAAYWNAQFEGWKLIMSWFWAIEAEIMATMLIGMALYQWGVIQGKAKRSTYWAMVVIGYGFGLASRGSLWIDYLKFQPGSHWQEILMDLDRLAVTFGHLGLIHLALATAAGKRMLKPFEAAGRMPLTIYLFTSLLMMWLVFAPWGLGLFGRWGVMQLMEVAAAIILAELVAANVWMRHFDNGPMEWLWKSLAYQRREPFRKSSATLPDAVPSPI